MGSAKFTNEAAYLNRKFAAFWGTNNSDHQARICHSTTVTGVANTWGYGAMTNSYNDIRNAKTIMVMGGNPAEAHPVSLQHILEGKELNRANMIVIDPRLTRTAAHANEFLRVRPGTHIPTIYGMLWHIFKNGWEDKEFIRQRVYGLEDILSEVEKWTPAGVERVTGLPEAQVRHVAEIFATERPSTLIWAMGQTQFATGTANVRASCLLLLATGNVGAYGAGANIFRGHTNVQGATDLGLDVTSLPLYYGLAEEAWQHWCRVWEVDYNWMLSRFVDKKFMEAPGIPSTRWFDATLLPKDQVSQPDTLKAMFVMGHGANTITRMPESVRGIEKLDLLVVCDPYPTSWSVLSGRKNVAIKHGCCPYGNGKARMIAWNLPDPVPVHREPIYTPRPDLVSKYPTLPDAQQFRVPNIGFTIQKAAVDKGIVKDFPLILSSGRLVEYEGGGEETRSNRWLAELKQEMFVEINPADAAERGIADGGDRTREPFESAHEGLGDRARGQGLGLDAFSLCRLVAGRRSTQQISKGRRCLRAR